MRRAPQGESLFDPTNVSLNTSKRRHALAEGARALTTAGLLPTTRVSPHTRCELLCRRPRERHSRRFQLASCTCARCLRDRQREPWPCRLARAEPARHRSGRRRSGAPSPHHSPRVWRLVLTQNLPLFSSTSTLSRPPLSPPRPAAAKPPRRPSSARPRTLLEVRRVLVDLPDDAPLVADIDVAVEACGRGCGRINRRDPSIKSVAEAARNYYYTALTECRMPTSAERHRGLPGARMPCTTVPRDSYAVRCDCPAVLRACALRVPRLDVPGLFGARCDAARDRARWYGGCGCGLGLRTRAADSGPGCGLRLCMHAVDVRRV